MTDPARDFTQIQQQIAGQLERALRMQQELAQATPATATAESADGEVAITVDERGLLAGVRFGSAIADLGADELAEVVMSTVRDARSRRRPSLAGAGGAAALQDDTLRRRLVDLATTLGGSSGGTREERA